MSLLEAGCFLRLLKSILGVQPDKENFMEDKK